AARGERAVGRLSTTGALRRLWASLAVEETHRRAGVSRERWHRTALGSDDSLGRAPTTGLRNLLGPQVEERRHARRESSGQGRSLSIPARRVLGPGAFRVSLRRSPGARPGAAAPRAVVGVARPAAHDR